MKFHDRDNIICLFDVMNNSCVEWLLLRNTDDELPDKLLFGKDVDVLVRYENRNAFRKVLLKSGFRQISHPLFNDIKLYGVHEFEMYRSKNNVLLDVNFEIAVRSLDQGQWIPLDQSIQSSAWQNMTFINLAGVNVPVLGNEDLFVAIIVRCVYDKKYFSHWHVKKLNLLIDSCDDNILRTKLKVIFFRYSDRLLKLAMLGNYCEIIDDYLSYADY
jgi:hypothetical protein